MAQDFGQISGYVNCTETEQPLIAANVYLKNTFIGTATDENGNYIIDNIPPGKYEIVVDIIGYMNVPPTPFTRKDLEKPDSPGQPFAPGNDIVLEGYTTKSGVLEETVVDLASEDTIERDLARLSENIDRPFIFVAHSPPYNTPLDVLYNNVHAGSVSISNFIKKWARRGILIASFHGHIHESPDRSGSIIAEMEGVLCINPGQGSGVGAKFRYVIFELAGNRVLRIADVLKVG